MTLKQIYKNYLEEQRRLRVSPSNVFVGELAELTHRSNLAVRRWLSDGDNATTPDALVQEVLAKHFHTTPEELFPKKQIN